jgi:hypothetical protein
LSAWFANFRTLCAPLAKTVKITGIKTMGLDSVGDGCVIRIDTDAGLTGYGDAGLPFGGGVATSRDVAA